MMLFAGRLGHCGEDADGGQQSYVETSDAGERAPAAGSEGAGSLGIITAARRGPQRNAEVQRQGELPQSPTSYGCSCARAGVAASPRCFNFLQTDIGEAVHPTFFVAYGIP